MQKMYNWYTFLALTPWSKDYKIVEWKYDCCIRLVKLDERKGYACIHHIYISFEVSYTQQIDGPYTQIDNNW